MKILLEIFQISKDTSIASNKKYNKSKWSVELPKTSFIKTERKTKLSVMDQIEILDSLKFENKIFVKNSNIFPSSMGKFFNVKLSEIDHR